MPPTRGREQAGCERSLTSGRDASNKGTVRACAQSPFGGTGFFGDLTFHPGSAHRPMCVPPALGSILQLPSSQGKPAPSPWVRAALSLLSERQASSCALSRSPHCGSSVGWGLGGGTTFILPCFWPPAPTWQTHSSHVCTNTAGTSSFSRQIWVIRTLLGESGGI